MRFILYRASELASQEELKFGDMVKFAKIVLPSLYKPDLFFKDLIENKNQSFKHDVDNSDLLELVNQIQKRVSESEVAFEHLQMSSSRYHNSYRPYTAKTFLLLRRIMDDLLS